MFKVDERAESEIEGASLDNIRNSNDFNAYKPQTKFSEDRFSDEDVAAIAEIHPYQLNDNK